MVALLGEEPCGCGTSRHPDVGVGELPELHGVTIAEESTAFLDPTDVERRTSPHRRARVLRIPILLRPLLHRLGEASSPTSVAAGSATGRSTLPDVLRQFGAVVESGRGSACAARPRAKVDLPPSVGDQQVLLTVSARRHGSSQRGVEPEIMDLIACRRRWGRSSASTPTG
jgi:UDP-N-acetylglucosamine enolpyruvyl transferase